MYPASAYTTTTAAAVALPLLADGEEGRSE